MRFAVQSHTAGVDWSIEQQDDEARREQLVSAGDVRLTVERFRYGRHYTMTWNYQQTSVGKNK